MKRETLKELGLTGEQIDAVMSDHGSSVNELRKQLTAVEVERDQFKTQLETNQTELETKFAEQQKDFAIKYALKGGDACDNDIVLGLLDRDAISVNDGEVQGLNEQLNSLRVSKGFLFKQAPEEPTDPTPTIVTGGNPNGGGSVEQDAFSGITGKYK